MIINDLFNNKKQGMAEGTDKLQGTPVVSLKDFGDKDNKKNKYGQTVPKKLKKDDPRVKFHKDQKQGVAEGKKPDSYHIVNKDGKPATLASYADRASAEKDRDAKHPGAEVKQLGPRGKVKSVSEVSLGDYRKKAALDKAVAQTDRFFGRDDAAKVASADQTIAKRERGLARADARSRPYTPPPHDAEKYQRELTAKYPNIDELVRKAELNRDPNYEYADGPAYYAAREAEQNYQKLKQIQRVIQGLNESRQKLDEFNPFNKKKVTAPDPTPEPQTASGGIKFDLMGRPYKPAPVTTEPEPAVEPVAEPISEPISKPKTAITTAGTPKFNTGYLPGAPELQTIDAPAQLTGPAQAKQLGMADPNIIDVVAKEKPAVKKQPAANVAALPAPAAPITPNYGKGVAGYGKTTMNPTAAFPSGASNMMPTNMMPNTAKTAPTPAVSTTAAKNDIVAALKKLGYTSKQAQAAVQKLPPGISTSDAIRQVLRGKPTATTESLTWSRNFNPGRSLYNKMKQDH